MNHILADFARQWLKDNLALCTEGQRGVFIKMYATDRTLALPEVIDAMPRPKLDWAMEQVEKTLLKNGGNR
jgi:hypothetical protein